MQHDQIEEFSHRQMLSIETISNLTDQESSLGDDLVQIVTCLEFVFDYQRPYLCLTVAFYVSLAGHFSQTDGQDITSM